MNLQTTAAAAYGASAFFEQQAQNLGSLQFQGPLAQQSQGLLQAIAPALASALQQALSEFQGQGAGGWGMPAGGFPQNFGGQLPMLPGSPLAMPGQPMFMPQPMQQQPLQQQPMLPLMPQGMPAMPMPQQLQLQQQLRSAAPTPFAPTGGNAAPMSFQAAAGALGAEFENLKDGSGHVTMDKLKQIAAQGPGNGVSPAAFAVATHFVNNPMQFNALENANAAANPNGAIWNDNKVAQSDLQAVGVPSGVRPAVQDAVMPTATPATPATPAAPAAPAAHTTIPNTPGTGGMDYDKAVRTVASEFDKVKNKDGFVTFDRLKDIVKEGVGPNVSPDMLKAAEHFVNNKSDFDRLEMSRQNATAGSAIRDGKVSMKDINEEIPKVKVGEGDAKIWNDLFSNQKGLLNGDDLFDKNELKKLADTGILADGTKASPEQQRAAQAVMSRPDMLVLLDSAAHSKGNGDGIFSKQDIEKVLKRAQGEKIR